MKLIIFVYAICFILNAHASDITSFANQAELNETTLQRVMIDIMLYPQSKPELLETPRYERVKKCLNENPSLINEVDLNGNTLLMQSVKYYGPTMFALICSFNPNVNAQNNTGQTACHIAMMNKYHPAFKVLQRLRPDLSIKDENGYTAQQVGENKLAELKQQLKQVRVNSEQFKMLNFDIIDYERKLRVITRPDLQIEMHPSDQESQTAQKIMEIAFQIKHYLNQERASASGLDLGLNTQTTIQNIHKVKSFLDEKADNINAAEPAFEGNTIFMYCAQLLNPTLRTYCYNKKPDLNARNKKNQTALHLCVLESSEATCKDLIDAKADQTIRDDAGDTAKMAGKKRVEDLAVLSRSLTRVTLLRSQQELQQKIKQIQQNVDLLS